MAVKRALQPALQSGTLRKPDFSLKHCHKKGKVPSSNKSFTTHASFKPECEDFSFVVLKWNRMSSEAAYDMQLLARPTVHPSVNEEGIAGIDWVACFHHWAEASLDDTYYHTCRLTLGMHLAEGFKSMHSSHALCTDLLLNTHAAVMPRNIACNTSQSPLSAGKR